MEGLDGLGESTSDGHMRAGGSTNVLVGDFVLAPILDAGSIDMNLPEFETLLLRRDGKVLHATMNRPEALNAAEGQMHHELEQLFGVVGTDPGSNVLVLTGAGRAFSAGGDIGHMERSLENPELFHEDMQSAKRMVFSILDCPKPIIAKINGHAIGLGATIALFCDLAIATRQAKIADPHVAVGYVAGDGGAVIWPQLIGFMKAKECLLTGDALTGEEAARIGLINRAVDPGELDSTVDQIAQRLASGASKAIQWTKQSINIQLKQVAHSVLDASMALEALSNATEDHREAVRAFRDKRKPNFVGR